MVIEATERRGPAIEPREIKQEGDSGLRITWADGLRLRLHGRGVEARVSLCSVRQRVDWSACTEAGSSFRGTDDS